MRSNRATLSSPVTHNKNHRSLGRSPTSIGHPARRRPSPSLATQQPNQRHSPATSSRCAILFWLEEASVCVPRDDEFNLTHVAGSHPSSTVSGSGGSEWGLEEQEP